MLVHDLNRLSRPNIHTGWQRHLAGFVRRQSRQAPLDGLQVRTRIIGDHGQQNCIAGDHIGIVRCNRFQGHVIGDTDPPSVDVAPGCAVNRFGFQDFYLRTLCELAHLVIADPGPLANAQRGGSHSAIDLGRP